MHRYMLWHRHQTDDWLDDKVIGVFSTRQQAEEVQDRLLGLPGFKESAQGFTTTEMVLNEFDEYAVLLEEWDPLVELEAGAIEEEEEDEDEEEAISSSETEVDSSVVWVLYEEHRPNLSDSEVRGTPSGYFSSVVCGAYTEESLANQAATSRGLSNWEAWPYVIDANEWNDGFVTSD